VDPLLRWIDEVMDVVVIIRAREARSQGQIIEVEHVGGDVIKASMVLKMKCP
jgi:hypothetical protein